MSDGAGFLQGFVCALLIDCLETARRDTIADAMLEGQFVFHAATQVDAVESKGVELALEDVEPHEIEQQVRREIAARRDHVERQLADAHTAQRKP